jgi:anti-anti-sigma regulatory factor
MIEINECSNTILSQKGNHGLIDFDVSELAIKNDKLVQACVEVVHKLWSSGGALVLRGVSDSLRKEFEDYGVAIGKYFTEASSSEDADKYLKSLFYKNRSEVRFDHFGALSVTTKTIENNDAIVLVTVSGIISLVSSALLKAHIIRLLKMNWKKVCIKLVNVTATNSHSHGLYDLAKISVEYENNGAMFALCIGASPAVHDWLSISGLIGYIKCFEELEQVIHYFKNDEKAKSDITNLVSGRDSENETSYFLIYLNGIDKIYDPQYHLQINLYKPVDTDKCLILYPSGYIDSSNLEYFRKHIDSVIQNGYFRLIVSFRDMPTTRSSSLWSEILLIRNQLRLLGGDIVLTEINDGVIEMIKLLGFGNDLNICPTINDATKYFKNNLREYYR